MEDKEWYERLTKVLECPVCLVIPESSIFICSKGHSICDLCRIQLKKCPICTSDFLEDVARNFVAQDLVSTLEQLKESQFSKIFPKTFLVHTNEFPTQIDFAFSVNNMVIIFLKFIIRKGSLKCCVVFINKGASLPLLGYEAKIISEAYYENYYGKVKPYTILQHDTANIYDVCFHANQMSNIVKTESFHLIFTVGTVKSNAVE